MNPVCILTDSAAQFPQLGFSGINHVRVIPYSVELNGHLYPEGQEIKANDLPPFASTANSPHLVAPSADQFQELFLNLSLHYRDTIVLLSSASLTKAYENAQKARQAVMGRVQVSVIDSETTSVGLGLMVQTAAECLARGLSAAEIEQEVRSLIPHTYMVMCTPSLSYLHYAGILDDAQAFVGEMLGLIPIFVLEEGQVSAVEKVRNSRGLVDFIQEFILEFENIIHIAFIQSIPGMTHEARLVRELAQSTFPQMPFSEHTINLALAALIGPRSIGLVVVEKPETARR